MRSNSRGALQGARDTVTLVSTGSRIARRELSEARTSWEAGARARSTEPALCALGQI